ncbi:MAG: glycoside hydrolase family 97 protein [Sphingobacteriaceae bacterium]|nr:MAG: glycoside hydrolase family 97 protein [Sphingobacteriaceae bacterium]
MKKYLLLYLFFLFCCRCFAADIDLVSPNQQIKVRVNLTDQIYYSIDFHGQKLMENSAIRLDLSNKKLGENPKLIQKKYEVINTALYPKIPLKNSKVLNSCNVLLLQFKSNFKVEFRAYNDGIAYRFITDFKDSVVVKNETAHFGFTGNVLSFFSEAKSFKSDYQILYARKNLSEIDSSKMSVLPVLFDNHQYKILISEADLHDYPCMFLKGTGSNALNGTFPKVPLVFGNDGDRSVKILKEANYIAKTSGKRSFPWRFLLITDSDTQIPENEMVTKLSGPSKIENTTWIKPGQVTWEWWHNAAVYGVDFKSGYNQETYKYYIDFASKQGIPYILMDEGWAKSTMNPFDPNPTINLHELIAYGNKKNVRIILWFTWLAVEKNFNVFKTLHDWGIAGMKIDFMDRSDQWMVNYYERVAKEAAKNQLFVDFHGAFKPAGLGQAYPNVLSYEGVVGMEINIGGGFATPDNNIYLPYLRNAVGPMDYTPGAMRSVHPKDYHGNRNNPMSIGTRTHQLSMYVIFESGLQMLADNPYNYLKEPESTQFITSVPVTWDETKVLAGEAGEYIVTARRKGSKWFIGGMTNHLPRNLTIGTNFLDKNSSYTITLIQDGVNADVQATDYKKIVKPIKAGDQISIDMVADGGWVGRIELNK